MYFGPRALTTRANKPQDLTGYKTKFLTDVEESSSMLTQQLALRYSHRMLNASAQNEDGVCQFSPTWATNRLP